MTTFTTAKVLEMVAVAVGGLERRTISVTLQSGEKLNMSVKNFVLRSVAEQLKETASDEEVVKAVEHYDKIVMPLEDIMSVGQIRGGHRRKTGRSRHAKPRTRGRTA